MVNKLTEDAEKQKIGIVGTRTNERVNEAEWNNHINTEVLRIVAQYDPDKVIFISGAARSGADHETEIVCKLLGYEYDGQTYKPDFSEGYGAWKFFERNKRLAEDVSELYCLWDGQSKGTKHIIEYMQKLIKTDSSKKLHIIQFEEMLRRPIIKVSIHISWLMPPSPLHLLEIYVVEVLFIKIHPLQVNNTNPSYYVVETEGSLRYFLNEILNLKYSRM
jgi:hypothetical protein